MFQDNEKRDFLCILTTISEGIGLRKSTLITTAKQLEWGCHTATYAEAKKYGIKLSWTEGGFIMLYSKYCSLIKLHMNPNSTVKDDYLSNKLIEYMIMVEANGILRYLLGSLTWSHGTHVGVTYGKIMDYIMPPNMITAPDCAKLQPRELSNNMDPLIDMVLNHKEDVVEEKFSTLYRCKKCGANKAKYKDVQLRGFDEGKSLVLTCLPCGWTWIIY